MRPYILVYAEVSADGKTTHQLGMSSKPMMAFEDAEVRKYRHELRAASDAIVVGSNTIRLDDPLLNVRYASGTNPLRVVPTSLGDLPITSNIFTDGGQTLIAVSKDASTSRIEALKRTGKSVVVLGKSKVDLVLLLEHLREIGIRSAMVEGGATLLGELFRAQLVDRLIVQQLPVIFGGHDVPSMVGGQPLARISDAIRLHLADLKRIGGHAVMVYDVEKGRE